MALDFRTFVDGLGDVSVTGVTRAYDAPPHTLNTADLPAMYPRLATGRGTVGALTGARTLDSATAELVIVVEPVGQASHSVNQALALDLMDALHAALTSSVNTLQLDGWQMRIEAGLVGDTEYWLLIAEVTASG